jgi:hypothetical protein
VLGTTTAFGEGKQDLWALRLDAGGAVAWQRTYGGAGEERARRVFGAQGGGFVLAKLPNRGLLRNLLGSLSVGKRLALLKVVEGGEVAWRKWLRSPDVDYDYAFAAPALLVRPRGAGGYLLARDVHGGPKGWLGLGGADKGGGFLLRRWDEGRADECFEDDDSRVSLPDVKIERVKAKLSAFPPETEARPAAGITRETSIAPAPAPACVIEEKKK